MGQSCRINRLFNHYDCGRNLSRRVPFRIILVQIVGFAFFLYQNEAFAFSTVRKHRSSFCALARTSSSPLSAKAESKTFTTRSRTPRNSYTDTRRQLNRNAYRNLWMFPIYSSNPSSIGSLTKKTPATERETKIVDDKTSITVATVITIILSSLLVTPFLISSGSWRYFVSGGVCAALSHALPTPVDVIKTRKQVDPKLIHKKFIEAGRTILKEEGVDGLWAGVGPTSLGYLLEGGIKFGLYEILKSTIPPLLKRIAKLSRHLSFMESQLFAFTLSGFASGFVATLVLVPMEVIRIRLVSEPDSTTNSINCGLKILKNEGIQGFTKGLSPMLLKQIPYTICKNVVFDIATKFLYMYYLGGRGAQTISSTIKFVIPLTAAAIASILSSLMSQPGDTILSLSCAHGGDKKVRDICKDILENDHGFKGFFVGTRTRLLHVGLIVTIQLLMYDYFKRICGIGATGL